MLVHNSGPTYSASAEQARHHRRPHCTPPFRPRPNRWLCSAKKGQGKGRPHACTALFAVDHPVTLPARPGPRAARAFHFRVDLARLTASLRDLTVGAPSSSLLLEKLPELDPKSLRNVHGGRSRSTGSGKPRRYRCGAFSCRCRMPADTLPVLLLSYLGERNIASFSTDIDLLTSKCGVRSK